MQSPYNVTIRIKAVTSFLLGERCETCDVIARKVFQLVRRYYKKTDACCWTSVSMGGVTVPGACRRRFIVALATR